MNLKWLSDHVFMWEGKGLDELIPGKYFFIGLYYIFWYFIIISFSETKQIKLDFVL